jgi:hypothetical protein
MNKIYVAKDGMETGPFGEDQIAPMVDSGMLGLTDHVWHKDLTGGFRFISFWAGSLRCRERKHGGMRLIHPRIPDAGQFNRWLASWPL